jgi:hypothetical protein
VLTIPRNVDVFSPEKLLSKENLLEVSENKRMEH